MRNVALLLALCTSHVLTPRVVGDNATPSRTSLMSISVSASSYHSSPSTPSANRNTDEQQLSAFKILVQVVCVLVIIFGILGNALVLIIFGYRCSSLKPFETFMVNLAVADFLGTLVFPGIQLHTILGGSFHYIGNEGCKIVYFLTNLSITESALSLILISVDRYLIVTRPLRENFSKLKQYLVIAITWILSCILAITHIVGNRVLLIDRGETMVCAVKKTSLEDQKKYTVYVVVIFVFQIVIPLIIMASLYSIIIWKLRQDRELVGGRESLRNTKVIRLLITIVVCFFVCVTPGGVFYLMYHFKATDMHPDHIFPVYAFLTMLLMMNSCINPIIYTTMHPSFGKRLWRLLTLCCCRRDDESHLRNYRDVHSAMTAAVMYPSLSSPETSVEDQLPLSEITDHDTLSVEAN